MNNKKISVIVPAYNIAAYLPRCLDSILAQTHSNLDVIVIDDGSTDGTAAVIDDYVRRDCRIRAIHQTNGGVVYARFQGIRAAVGDWIGFIDGDDFIEPDMYERLLNNAEMYDADISHCGYQMVFPSKIDLYYGTGTLSELDHIFGLQELLSGGRIEPGLWNKLYKSSLFSQLLNSGTETSGILINEDLLMNFYLFRAANKTVFEDICPYHYILRTASATGNKQRECHFRDPVLVRKQICDMTIDVAPLYPIALRSYVHSLIHNVLQKQFPLYSKMAKAELKRIFHEERSVLPQKERYMTLLSTYFTPLYRIIRWGYEKITRVNHKYDVE